MYRFYSPNADLQTEHIKINDPAEIHHISNVLRLKKGDVIAVFNGKGEEGIGTLISVDKYDVRIQLSERKKNNTRSRHSVILACAIPKKAKFEFIIEKCTELNVEEIIPMTTLRTEVHYSAEKAKQKIIRYQKIAINAAKQCKRCTLPVIHPITDFKTIIKNLNGYDAAFIPSLIGDRIHIIDALKRVETQRRVILFIGPEGDFSPDEVHMAIKAGGIPVTLGDTVLKVDTAAITAVGITALFSSHE